MQSDLRHHANGYRPQQGLAGWLGLATASLALENQVPGTQKTACKEIGRTKTVGWRVRAIRGAITVPENSAIAIELAVTELLDELEAHNTVDPNDIVSLTFSVTRDLDAIFPASVARRRSGWQHVPLLDVQQMYVVGSLERCIRLLLHFNCDEPHRPIFHPYLRSAQRLRPDLSLPQAATP